MALPANGVQRVLELGPKNRTSSSIKPELDGFFRLLKAKNKPSWRLPEELIGYTTSAIVHFFALVLLGLIVPAEEDRGPIELSVVPSTANEALQAMEAVAFAQPTVDENLLEVRDLTDPLSLETEPEFPLQSESRTARPLATAASQVGLTEFSRRLQGAGAQTGDVQVSLAWNNFNDVDLHLFTPSGRHIFYSNKRSPDGGELDVDENVHPTTRKPVENIYFAKGNAPQGTYRIQVHLFRNHGDGDPSAFEVLLLVNGKRQLFRGHVSDREPWAEVHEFYRSNTPVMREF